MVDHFDIESVPSIAVVMPHKNEFEIVPGVTPEKMSELAGEIDSTFKQMYEKEK